MMAACTSQHPIRWRNPSMAQRLSFDERARVEAMSAAGVSVATAARCLGRHRSTVYRELGRGRRGGVYDAEAAQAAAAVGAARPKIPVLAADPELAASVRELLKEGWSPHALCAGLRAEGRTVSARGARSQRRRSTGPPMTTAAPAGCPRAPGAACRGAADAESPEAVTHESPARWAISGPSASVPHLSRTAASPATGRAT